MCKEEEERGDGVFVSKCDDDDDDEPLLSLAIELVGALGLRVGVERESMRCSISDMRGLT